MAVRIRMKRMGRTHRPFYRICAVDGRAARDGRVIEELGHYDPMLSETDARTVLKNDRVAYWLGVGAQPSENVAVLIKKYGENGTHVAAQQAALERIQANKPTAPPPVAAAAPIGLDCPEGGDGDHGDGRGGTRDGANASNGCNGGQLGHGSRPSTALLAWHPRVSEPPAAASPSGSKRLFHLRKRLEQLGIIVIVVVRGLGGVPNPSTVQHRRRRRST